jgi:hypothetical protein
MVYAQSVTAGFNVKVADASDNGHWVSGVDNGTFIGAEGNYFVFDDPVIYGNEPSNKGDSPRSYSQKQSEYTGAGFLINSWVAHGDYDSWVDDSKSAVDTFTPTGEDFNFSNSGASTLAVAVTGNNAPQGSFAGGAVVGEAMENYTSVSNVGVYSWILTVTDDTGTRNIGVNAEPPQGNNYNYNIAIPISGNTAVSLAATPPAGADGKSIQNDGTPSMTATFTLRPAPIVPTGTITPVDENGTPISTALVGSSVFIHWTLSF